MVDSRLVTPSQSRFIAEYVLHSNAARAGRAAGVTPSTAGNWLRRPEIRDAIAVERATYRRRYDVTRDRVIDEMATIAFAPLLAAETLGSDSDDGGGGGKRSGPIARPRDLPSETCRDLPVINHNTTLPVIYDPDQLVKFNHSFEVTKLPPVRAADKLKALDMLARVKGVEVYAEGDVTAPVVWNVQINL